MLPTSGAILDGIERGDVLIGYNVLGSYARARQRGRGPDRYRAAARLHAPDVSGRGDSRGGPPSGAGETLRRSSAFGRGQAVVAATAGLEPLLQSDGTRPDAVGLLPEAVGPVQPITLGPALLVFLDRMKRERFLADWSAAVRRP